METLNIQCIEQQQVLITLTLTDSNGAPVDLTRYAVYAASVGAVDPYCRRAARLEWAAAINNECSAFIVTAPGHDIARAPWKYQICIKNRQLGLEWAVVTGRVELTPRACGTDGISPASYSVACEATPSGLVNVTLDATVGSISTTLEQVKASAAAAAAAAQNAHADLEDAETAATKASQAALAAAADANNAMDAAARAEKAATDAPQACAPFVGQVQAAAVQAQQAATHAEEDANRASAAATTATEKAQIATDAAAAAASSATDLASARDTAVQAATNAQASQQTAQLASTTATTAAENAREYAEDAQQAKQAAATSETNAATAAQQASASASAAAASAATAQASAATAVSAKSDLETARDAATAAATTATDAATAAATSETNATAAATAAASAQTAAEAAQAQADTDARACAIYDQRVAANKAASDEAVATAQASAIAAASSATAAADSARELLDDELSRMVDVAAAAYGLMEMGAITGSYLAEPDQTTGIPRIWIGNNSQYKAAKIVVYKGAVFGQDPTNTQYKGNVWYVPELKSIGHAYGRAPFSNKGNCYMHAPALESTTYEWFMNGSANTLIMSTNTKFEKLITASNTFARFSGKVIWAKGTTFSALVEANNVFHSWNGGEFPDEFTFENLANGHGLFQGSAITKLPASMTLKSLTSGVGMLHGCSKLEVDELVRVVSTIQDLQSLDTPKTGTIGLPTKCYHAGEAVSDTHNYLNVHHPDFLTTLAAKGWTVTFA